MVTAISIGADAAAAAAAGGAAAAARPPAPLPHSSLADYRGDPGAWLPCGETPCPLTPPPRRDPTA